MCYPAGPLCGPRGASGHVTVPHKQAEHMAAPTSTAFKSNKSLPTGGRPHMAQSASLSRLHLTAACRG